ncbi:nucleoside triphosphate pyrophosphatase [Miniphocaeibacter massiliensis]|uniref:nucleoside triphosphate pyrophosphatase n=1 Tax=Miniphocaeibacter massiliensis TaxID=2041841 RepID=UPI000C1BB107|nr:Maf family protein [Miniphocaeibacter massiliensis]
MINDLSIVGVHDVCNSLKLKKNYPIILGSSSPRRIRLLNDITEDFKIIKPIVNEQLVMQNSFNKYKNLDFSKNAFLSCSDIALEKAKNIYTHNKDSLIISADTIVVTNNKILGKPVNYNNAFETLTSLLGKFHYVTTATCIYISENNYDLFYTVTGVKFVEKNILATNYIKKYVASGEPMDKAGSYGIQQVGSYLVEGIFGDYFNIVGFPILEVRRRLYENFN